MKTKIETKLKLILISFFCFYSIVVFGQSDRETWQPTVKIIDSLGVKPGMIIGEIGVGQGYFTFPLARRLGEKGKLYANDISENILNDIQSRSKNEKLNNIITILGETEDPLFPKEKFDMIIMVYVLHCLERPLEFMGNLKKYMKPNTKLVIIERNTSTDRAHYPSFMTKKQILEMIQKVDYKLERILTFLPKDNIYIYKIRN